MSIQYQAQKLPPGGDANPRKVADVVNRNAELTNGAQLQPVTLADLPDEAANIYQMRVCTDEAIGYPVPVWSDGTNWRRITDGAIAS